jgi:UDP-N-acetylglucosamine--N-acetylmuramyl-(pentapeptide) pyrophosphoryl-undecaprenol N-acetylglucosamine transferase
LSLQLFSAAFGLVASTILLLRMFLRERPDVILGTGGYVSAPAICVGRLLKIPVVLQEQNAVPGVVNRFLSRFADEVHVNFAGSRRYFKRKDNLRLTGNPLRPTLLSGNSQRALGRFRLEPDRTTVFVLGGSRGARSLSQAIVGAVKEMPRELRVQFLVQCGKQDQTMVAAELRSSPFPVSVQSFIEHIEDAYALADLVVCRAGAMTISEIAACGLPAILVPYPHATGNHQQRNAEDVVDRGAALMIVDAELDGDRLASALLELLRDPVRLREMATNAHRSAKYDSADRLASAVAALAGGRPSPASEADAAREATDDPEDGAPRRRSRRHRPRR